MSGRLAAHLTQAARPVDPEYRAIHHHNLTSQGRHHGQRDHRSLWSQYSQRRPPLSSENSRQAGAASGGRSRRLRTRLDNWPSRSSGRQRRKGRSTGTDQAEPCGAAVRGSEAASRSEGPMNSGRPDRAHRQIYPRRCSDRSGASARGLRSSRPAV